MSIEKWLSERESEEIKKKKEEMFKKLPKEEIENLKKKSIQKIVKKEDLKEQENDKSSDFLKKVIEFKDWLDGRTYLKGDLDKIVIHIQNLHKNIIKMKKEENYQSLKDFMDALTNLYKNIPPSFLDEKTRVALNKKCREIKRSNSDNYYLRKLKNTIKEKLNEAKYYEFLRELLDS